ncbi:MAG: hypothetical protein HFACDABA_02788 [Anaerolineales bacterium]|nr:hypothetical protein [Anaerolineales bacterium]
MPFLIDGHNLIPKAGINLRDAEDEMQLLEQLQIFCRVTRRSAEVYFDGAPTGQARTRKFGAVTAHFVRSGTTADSAIAARLKTLGRAARNWTVVTSDRQVQAAARACGAQVTSSEAFAEQMLDTLRAPAAPSTSEAGMSAAELEEWMRLFREGKR